MRRTPASHWLIAHRGYPAAYPENTLEGLHAALEGGARFVEFDVHLSADLKPVVIHDESLDRTSESSGNVHELPFADLLKINAGEPARFGTRFHESRIPSLSAALELVAGFAGATAFVELKRGSMRRFGRETILKAVLPELRAAKCPIVVLSFDAQMTAMAREQGGFAIGWVFEDWTDSARDQLETLQPDYVFTSAASVPNQATPFWPGPWRWAVYDVNDLALAKQIRARGADMIETDRILELLAEARQ